MGFLFRERTLVFGTVIAMFLLDNPAANPWHGVMAITELLGKFLYGGYGICLLEVIGAWILLLLILNRGFRSIFPFQDPYFRQMIGVVGGFFLAIVGAVGYGLATGGSLETVITQLRYVYLLPLWCVIGFACLPTYQVIHRLFELFSKAIIVKAVFAIGMYFVVFGGHLGDLEFLIDHFTSDYFATAMIFLIGTAVLRHLTFFQNLAIGASVCVILFPYLINDRRASMIGCALTIMLLPLVARADIVRKMGRPVLKIGLVMAVIFALNWNSSGVLGIVGNTYRSLTQEVEIVAEEEWMDEEFLMLEMSAANFRDFENFNLYSIVFDHLFTGMGYGKEVPLAIDIRDISDSFSLWLTIPHNAFLTLWAFGGPVVVSLFSLMLILGIAHATRIARTGKSVEEVLIGLVFFSMIVRFAVFVYADMALVSPRFLIFIALIFGGVVRTAAGPKLGVNARG